MILEEDFTNSKEGAVSGDDVFNALEKFKISEKTTPQDLSRLLQHQNALRYFKFNIDQYCELHRLIILKITDASELEIFLKSQNCFHKVIRDQEQFHSHFLKTVFPSLIEKCDQFKEVYEIVADTVAKCLFSSKEFTCYLSDHFESEKCTQKHNLCKALLKFCTSSDVSKTGFKLIFHSFCKACKNFRDIYRMLVVLMEIIGFDLKENFNFSKIKYQILQPNLQESLEVLNELLSVVGKLKVELENNINDVTFSDFIKNILKSVMALSQPNSLCYQIFFTAIEINPLIIESVINETLVYAMLSDNTNCKNEYETLIIKIFEVFNKLHRMQNLIAKMIPALKSAVENKSANETVYTFRGARDLLSQNTLYNVDEMLPKVVLDCFTSCIINLASWQVINLFKTMLFHLNKAVEELAEGKTESIYVEILSSFTCWLLQSVRMAEHTVAETTVMKFVAGLDELKTILAKFGSTLLQKEHNHVLMRAFLNICYFWAEVYMMLEYYSPNNQIKMETNTDTNIASCNITYLHSYLGEKEWYLISERIKNFGEKPCKAIMQKLLIQKLRALMVFNVGNMEDVTASIIRTLSSDFHGASTEIFLDDFVVNNILTKMPTNVVISLSEVIVKDLVDKNTTRLERPHISDSQLLANGILTVIFTRMHKLLKQKRKHDDVTPRKALFSRAVSKLPADFFLGNHEEFYGNITEIVTESEEQYIDLKIHESKIELYLDLVRKIPVIFCPESVQKLVILLMMALRKDLNGCSDGLQRKCETVIISIVHHSRFTLLDLFEASMLLKLVVRFSRCDDLFFHVAQNVFRNEQYIGTFEPGINHIKENLKEDNYLRLAVITLNLLTKVKKNKMSAVSKKTCSEYKCALSAKLTKRILKSKPEDSLIEAYALVLKTYLTKDENDTLSKLKSCLDIYIEYCLSNASDANVRGFLLLFTTVLHNKAVLETNSELVLRIWNTMKNMTIRNDSLEEYSQLVMLITTLIPNEQFPNIFTDLLKSMTNSIDSNDEFSKHLKTWSCILSTNFNSIKTNILREKLEFLLEKLLLVLKLSYEEVIQFEISIIQANHVPLTAPIMDFLLLSVSTSLMSNSHDFVRCFNVNILLLENLLKYRRPLIMDRLPPYLLQYRVLLKELCMKSSSTVTLTEYEVQRLADCAHKLEKLTKNLIECTKDMSRIAMYLIADILGQYELDTLYPNVKKHLNNCIYSLISLCDQHAVQYLMRVLSNASTEIFKIMYENYKKYYRFTGKV